MYTGSRALQLCVDWFKTRSFPCSPTAHMSELFVAVLYTVNGIPCVTSVQLLSGVLV
jgi:hypothetical protein